MVEATARVALALKSAPMGDTPYPGRATPPQKGRGERDPQGASGEGRKVLGRDVGARGWLPLVTPLKENGHGAGQIIPDS